MALRENMRNLFQRYADFNPNDEISADQVIRAYNYLNKTHKTKGDKYDISLIEVDGRDALLIQKNKKGFILTFEVDGLSYEVFDDKGKKEDKEKLDDSLWETIDDAIDEITKNKVK